MSHSKESRVGVPDGDHHIAASFDRAVARFEAKLSPIANTHVQSRQDAQAHIFAAALLEQLCDVYESRPRVKKRVFEGNTLHKFMSGLSMLCTILEVRLEVCSLIFCMKF